MTDEQREETARAWMAHERRESPVMSIKLIVAVMCGDEDIYDGVAFTRCPKCGDEQRIILGRAFRLREKENGPTIVPRKGDT